MSRKLTASDRKNLIKLAASLPKGDKQRLTILHSLRSDQSTEHFKTSNTNKTALRAEDDRGDEYEIDELEDRVKNTIKELENLLKESKGFLNKLRSGEIEEGDQFLDFTPAIENGYDRTGPVGIVVVD